MPSTTTLEVRMRRPIPAVISLFALLITLCISARAQVTIYRDKFGTPSISADKLVDAVYGLGYAMAMDNAERMALNYKQARGRMAEVQGRGALLADGFLR